MKLKLWTLYKKPLDYPDSWVIREWLIDFSVCNLGDIIVNEPTKKDAVAKYFEIKQGRYALHPLSQHDDPCIEGVWI